MNSQATYAFYGSLRSGMANYAIYRSSLQHIKTVRLPGFKLYALTHYPYAVKSARVADSIVAEIFRVTNKQAERSIHALELQAGYFYDEVVVDDLPVGIYLYPSAGNHPVVEGGDWVHFFGC